MKIKLLLFCAVLLCGCGKWGEIKTEQAEVLQLAYVPSTSGIGVGSTTGGNVAIVPTGTDEVWAVVLRCKEHNRTFSIRGKDNKEL